MSSELRILDLPSFHSYLVTKTYTYLVRRLWEHVAEATTTDIVNNLIRDLERILEGCASHRSDIRAEDRRQHSDCRGPKGASKMGGIA